MTRDDVDRQHFARVDTLFRETAGIAVAERDAWLESRTDVDPEVVAEVRAMLRAEARASGLTQAIDRSVRVAAVDGRGDTPGLERVGPNVRVGAYRMIRPLGGGGMGVVWLAEQESLDRTVALKLIRPELLFFDGALERFRREARIVASLSHPAIVQVFDAGEVDGLPYIAMACVPGRTLAELLDALADVKPEDRTGAQLFEALAVDGEAESEPPSWFAGTWMQIAFRIAGTIARALEHAHERGVLHRDVKPSNIMLTADGQVQLLDFGIAVGEESSTLTQSGMPAGSLPYMSPEQIRGEAAAIDAQSDVFGLGMTLYECLAGSLSHAQGTVEEVRQRVLDGDIRSLRGVGARVTWEAETVCHTAIATHPNDRYRTMRAFREDLESVLELRPIQAHRPRATRRILRWAQRRPMRAVAVALGAVVVALGVGLGAAWPAIQKAREAAIRAEVESGFFEAAQNRAAVAAEIFERALVARPGDVEAIAGRALVALQRRRATRALDILDRYAPGSENATLVFLRTAALEAAGRVERAAKLRAELEEPGDAFALYVAALELRGRVKAFDDDARRRAIDLMTRCIFAAPSARRIYHFELARAFSSAADREGAEQLGRAMLALWGHEDPKVWFHIALAWRRTDLARCAEAFTRSLELESNASAWANLGHVRLLQQREAEAELAYRNALVMRPDDLNYVLGVGTALAAQGKTRRVRAWYERHVDQFPGDPALSLRLARLACARDRPAQEVAILRRGMARLPDSAALQHALVRALTRQGRLDEAAAELDGVAREDRATHISRALLQVADGSLDAAVRSFRRAFAAGGDMARLRQELGGFARDTDIDALAPESRTILLDTLLDVAREFRRRGNDFRARGMLDRALAIEPAHTDARLLLVELPAPEER